MKGITMLGFIPEVPENHKAESQSNITVHKEYPSPHKYLSAQLVSKPDTETGEEIPSLQLTIKFPGKGRGNVQRFPVIQKTLPDEEGNPLNVQLSFATALTMFLFTDSEGNFDAQEMNTILANTQGKGMLEDLNNLAERLS